MKEFPLKIVTPAGQVFDGLACSVTVRTTSGDVTLLAGHLNYVAPLGMGQAVVVTPQQRRLGACIGGMVSMLDGCVTIVPTTFEWAEDIDVDRAKVSEKRAKTVLEDSTAAELDLRMASARLKRALIRQNVAAHKPK